MVTVKLVRTDTTDPCKITLAVGSFTFGRGALLKCDDKRVSRKHGQLEVMHDFLSVKALHHNPCFYTKKGSKDVQVLKCNKDIGLQTGDCFGLLPDKYWFEIIICSGLESEIQNGTDQNVESANTIISDDINDCNSIDNETMCNDEETVMEDLKSSDEPECPYLLSSKNQLNEDQSISEQNINKENEKVSELNESTPETNSDITKENESNRTPTKRPHSADEEHCKKIKLEPPDIKHEPQPGPSIDYMDSSNANHNNINMPGSPQKPQQVGRERCYYGANCYRKNPTHLSQFCHPNDDDWGNGDKGVCPYGAGCAKADIRHWNIHQHPPGISPPPPRQGKTCKKKRKVSEDELPEDLIIEGKRERKVIKRDVCVDSEPETEPDPYGTDESDEWQPSADPRSSPDNTDNF